MYSGQQSALQKHLSKGFPVLKWLMILVLVLGLSGCFEQAKSTEAPVRRIDQSPPSAQISGQFSETAPPAVIQELRSALEIYQPQVKILSPLQDEILQKEDVTVDLQVKDLSIFKDPQWQLGPHLHVFLDNQPYQPVYDLNQPLVLKALSPGTHTLRVFASRPWHESFKNEGAYAQTTFHIFTKTEDNNPDSSLPLLTYSRPQGSYGAEPILLDFYLTNAPLHIVAEDNPDSTVSNWRIRCTINGESFIFDRWQSVYLKGFKPGKNWVKLEFLDNQGNSVKNAFNTTARLITYEPNGNDTLSRIVRGELTADEVRGIVDPNYITKIPTPIPTVEPKPQPQVTEPPSKIEVLTAPKPEPEVTPTPTVLPTPQIQSEPTPEPTPEIQSEPTPKPTLIPQPEPTPQIQSEPTPEPTPIPQPEVTPTPPIQPEPQPELVPIPPKFTNRVENQLKNNDLNQIQQHSSKSLLSALETFSMTSPYLWRYIYP
jgi:hypothetical protein